MTTLFKNLKFRILLGLFLFLFAIFYSFGYIVVYTLENSYKKSMESALFTVLKDVKHDYFSNKDLSESLEEVKDEFNIPLLYSQLLRFTPKTNTQEVSLHSSDLKSERLIIEEAVLHQSMVTPTNVIFSKTSNPKLTQNRILIGTLYLEQKGDQILFLQCALPYDKHTPQIQAIIRILWIGLLSILATILMAVYLVISKSFSSIQEVTNKVKILSSSDLSTTIPKTHVAKEVDHLIDTFNTLFKELQHAYIQVKQFGQNASHELKTPLTIIKGEIEVGLRKERSVLEYQTILSNVMQEVQKLQEVIEKILFLSSTNKHALQEHFQEIYIDELLLETMEEKTPFAHQKEIELRIETLLPLSLQGNALLFKIVLTNLFDNAIKYAPFGSYITINLTENALMITNKTLSLSQNNLDSFFEPFYRDETTKHSVQGHGLGLAIVKNILELHGFSITMERISDENIRVAILF